MLVKAADSGQFFFWKPSTATDQWENLEIGHRSSEICDLSSFDLELTSALMPFTPSTPRCN
jgi:hypothetical protein